MGRMSNEPNAVFIVLIRWAGLTTQQWAVFRPTVLRFENPCNVYTPGSAGSIWKSKPLPRSRLCADAFLSWCRFPADCRHMEPIIFKAAQKKSKYWEPPSASGRMLCIWHWTAGLGLPTEVPAYFSELTGHEHTWKRMCLHKSCCRADLGWIWAETLLVVCFGTKDKEISFCAKLQGASTTTFFFLSNN